MFGDEAYGNDNRIMLSTVLRGVRARYDVLLIATGSRPLIPPMETVRDETGEIRRGVFGFCTLDDCAGMMAPARTAKRAAVLGGGLLGLEAARGLTTHGPGVAVAHLGAHPMKAQRDAEAGAILRDTMQAMGSANHLGRRGRLRDGRDRRRDQAEHGARVRRRAERATGDRGRQPRARHRGRVYGLMAPLWEQARVFADQVTRRDLESAYHGSKRATKLKVMGVELASTGLTEPQDRATR